MTITASPACIAAIKRFEGCPPATYLCPVGMLTGGYGHTGADVPPLGTPVTPEQADAWLSADLARVAAELATLIGPPLTPNQADALISFGFNCGFAPTKCPTLRRLLKAGRYDAVPAELLRFTRGGGRVVPGLVARRHSEAVMFAVGADAPGPMPQAVTAAPVAAHAIDRATNSLSVRGFIGAGLAGIASLYSSGLDALARAASEATGVYQHLSALHLGSSKIAAVVGVVCLCVAFVRQLLPRSTP